IICTGFIVLSCQVTKNDGHSKSGANGKSDNQIKKVEQKIIVPSNGPYQGSNTQKHDLLHTKLEVGFDWQKQYLNGTATLTIKPYFYPQNLLTLDAKGFDIHEVKLVKPVVTDLTYTYDKRQLIINLDKTYTRNDTFLVSIKYTAKPNELPKGGSSAITEDKGLYFINPLEEEKGKPRQIWTQGETEASSCWFPTIDSPNERTTQEMYITVDSTFEVLSNGELIYSINNPDGTRTHYWKQDLPHAPYLFMMGIGEYSVITDKVSPGGKFDFSDLQLKYYVEPKYAPYAKAIFGNTPEMIKFFSELLDYKYPWNKYSQIVVRDFVSGAMENTTASVFMEALQVDDKELLDEHWDGIIAHELFHHWFGNLVTCESWSNLPLNESFANYSEYLWTEYKYGTSEADYLHYNEMEEYFDEAEVKQEPLIRYHYFDKEDMFDRHSYNKGGRVLHMLRRYVGDEAFFKALNTYLVKHQFTSVEIDELRMAFEDVTGEDLNWFFDQWFLSSGHPELKISHSYSPGSVSVKVTQVQDTTYTPVYKLPVTIDVWVGGIRNSYKVLVEKAEQVFTFPAAVAPQLVVFDSETQLLAKIDHQKTTEELVFQYQNSERFLTRYFALNQLFEKSNSDNPFVQKELQEVLTSALADSFWVIRDYALNQFSRYPIPGIASYIPVLESMALSDPKPAVRAKAIYLISSYDNKKYVHVYEKGLEEKPYSVVGASLNSYLKTGDEGIVDRVKEFEAMDNINIVVSLAEYFITSRNTDKYNWFKEKIMTSNDRELYALLHFFGQYLMLMETEEKMDGKKILQNIADTNRYDVIKSVAQLYLKMLN
ncbi:MAG TPA: M1 family metallopeptidase, partial [Cytophagaceae bacterium]